MRVIFLTTGGTTLVDDDVFEWASKFNWHAGKRKNTTYAIRTIKRKGKTFKILLHREILQAPKDLQVDHRDGEGLNNLRENLRLATSAQNKYNMHNRRKGKTSRFKGVMRHHTAPKWMARIQTAGSVKYLGLFESEEDAARVYDQAARQYFGEFACPNFP